VIFHPRDARHRPGCPFYELALAPQVNLAVEPNHITVDPDMNVLGVHFSIAFERIFDAFADIDDVYPRLRVSRLSTPSTPDSLRTAFSTVSFWYCQSTWPSRVIQPF